MTAMKSPYETAYQTTQEKLASLNLTEVAFNSSASLSDEVLIIAFLGESFKITDKGKQIRCVTNNREVKIAEKIILLHYLITADGMPLTRELIGFDNLSGANFYYPTYKARIIDLMLSTFKNGLSQFLNISKKIGAKIEPEDYDNTITNQGKAIFLVLPNIPINFIYWTGDKEIPPNVQILYDANITHYLPLEDIVVVTEILTHKIIRTAKEESSANPSLYDYH